MLSKKIILPIVTVGAAGIVGASIMGVRQVQAQSNGNVFSGLAQAIALKFNLNQNDVQSAILSYRQTNAQNMLKNKLDALVTAGKISGDQENAIINEVTSLKQKYMTGTKNKSDLQNMANDFRSFLISQNIDPAIIPIFTMRMKMGMHHGWYK